MRPGITLLSSFAVFALTRAALAFPSPDTTAVLYNGDVPESVALAQKYATARSIPPNQLCKVTGVVDTPDITFTDFQTKLFGPFVQCLKDGGAYARIEAVVVVHGLPIRVAVPAMAGDQNASVAGAIGVWRSTLDGTMTPLLGQPPGVIANCGSPCLAANWKNPLATLNGPFDAAWTVKANGVEWHPVLVTMLHGRSYADAEKLLTSAMDAEKNGPAKGEFLFMNGADAARGVLDGDANAVMPVLQGLGMTTSRVPFDANLTGKSLAAFATGTASIGMTIEGNTFTPGAVVDNLTSFGAVPQNFAAMGESQVSIARWVAKGVAGVHGTVDEPLNNCFPSRRFISDYAAGAPLAEAYLRRMPYQYWRNLVLGDPMAAPYAKRPKLAIQGLTQGQVIGQSVHVIVTATDAAGTGIANVKLYLDGVESGAADGDTLDTCVDLPARDKVQVLAVAQNNTGADALAKFPPKGWTMITVDGRGPGKPSCDAPPDAGPSGGDGGNGTNPPITQGGCSCDASGAPAPSSIALAALGALLLVRRRRR
jgi:MYXO-CTERM domain-containing protein